MPALASTEQLLLRHPLPPLRRHFCPTGPRIEYRRAGQAGPVVLLLHGIGSHSAGYRAQFAGLAASHQVVAWNAPGYAGSSGLPKSSPTLADYADRLHELVTGLKLERIHLVGSSWGSLIAGAYAARYPERLRRLVLAAPSLGYGRLAPAEKVQRIAARLDPANRRMPPGARAARFLGPEPDPLVVRRFAELGNAVHDLGLAQATRMLFDCDARDHAGQVQCPTRLLVGTDDRIAPADEHAWPLRDALPDVSTVQLPGCGHILKLEAPQRFNTELSRFFQ